MQGFKKCSNGHYYKDTLSSCPYCPSSSSNVTTGGNNKTEIFHDDQEKTISDKTNSLNHTVVDERSKVSPRPQINKLGSKTVIRDIDAGDNNSSKQYRATRKLVGWLVSYSLNSMGIDFKLFEGRNIIGRDEGCDITIQDQTVTSKHSIILFRTGKYIIKDELSTAGTFVNNIDIGSESNEINDGDKIKIGDTILYFRTSLFD